MPEDNVEVVEPSTPAPDKEPEPTPPDHEAEAAKWKAMARKHEEEARKNADAAARLRELELSGKSEVERLQIQLGEAQASAKQASIKAMKLEVAASKGLPPELAKVFAKLDVDNEVDMEAAADELLAAARPKTDTQPRSNLTDPLSDGGDSNEALLAAMSGRPL